MHMYGRSITYFRDQIKFQSPAWFNGQSHLLLMEDHGI